MLFSRWWESFICIISKNQTSFVYFGKTTWKLAIRLNETWIVGNFNHYTSGKKSFFVFVFLIIDLPRFTVVLTLFGFSFKISSHVERVNKTIFLSIKSKNVTLNAIRQFSHSSPLLTEYTRWFFSVRIFPYPYTVPCG